MHRHMTPLQISLMFHIHHRPKPLNPIRPGSPQEDAIRMFIDEGLIDYDDTEPCGFRMTDRGSAYVNYLQEMPLPVIQWVMP